MKATTMACEILKRTNDGNDLSPGHLYLLQCAVNNVVTEEGKAAFEDLHKQVVSGKYVKPWYHGIEHMTQDHEGYIYWKGKHVEHYSHDSYEDADKDAKELAERCRTLEAHGIPPTCSTAVWWWDKIVEYNFDIKRMHENELRQ